MLIDRSREALGFISGKWTDRDFARHPVSGVVIHTTGFGPYRRHRAYPQQFPMPYDAAIHIFTKVVTTGPHYVVCGETGKVAQLAPHYTTAWHVGSKGAWRYKLPYWATTRNVSGWTERWPGTKSPREFFGGKAWSLGSANQLSIGIEVTPPLSGPRDPWTPAAWDSLAVLTQELTDKFEIKLHAYNVLTHSDIHPMSRITKSGRLWDPGALQWPGPHTAIARLRGLCG